LEIVNNRPSSAEPPAQGQPAGVALENAVSLERRVWRMWG
jgi:hypothetical protein